jgi:hypothetical protein
MGFRLHSAVKYDVRYSNGNFNYAQKHINTIIECLSEGDFYCDNEFVSEYATTLDAPRNVLLKNVERILHPKEDWVNQQWLDTIIYDMEQDKEFNLTKEYVYKYLKEMLEESDEDCNYIHFSWF